MPNLNSVQIMGNLTRDPDLKFTPKGTAIASFGVAINRTWRDPNTQEKREETTFVDVEAYGKQAEVIGEYVKKGHPIFVTGRLKLDSWEDKETQQKRSKMKVVLEGFQFLASKQGSSAPSGTTKEEPGSDSPPPDSDIPF